MDAKLQRVIMESDAEAYLQILEERGVSPPFSFEEAKKLSDSDLRTYVRHLRDLARIPHTR